jgi:hypothetical protein
MAHSVKCIVLPIVLALMLTQVNAKGVSGERQFGPWVYGIAGGAVQQFTTDLREAEGSFSVSRWFIQPSIAYAWDRDTMVALSIGAGESTYKFSDAANLDGLSPWDRIRDYRLSVPVRFAAGERSKVIIIPTIRTYAEAGVDLDRGRSEGLIAGVSWRINDRLVLGPGFGWFSEPGDTATAFPIIVIDWKLTQRLTLATGRGLAASPGPGLTLTYSLNRHWELGLTGRYEKVRFAVDDSGPAPAGFGQDRSLPLLLTIDYSPWPMTNINLLMGAEFEGELRLEDEDGEVLGDVSYDPAPILGFSFSSRF